MTTPYLRRYYAGGGTSTTLNNSMASSDTSFTIVSATNWPSGGGYFVVVIDRGTSSEEKIRCSGNSGTTVTVGADGNGGRGYDGTSATTHNAGAPVSLCGAAIDFDEANQVVTQVLGQSGAAKGDILAMLSAAGPNTLTRVPIGSSTQVLGVSSGLPAWETPANGYGISGFAANPMTPAVSLSESSVYASTNTTLVNSATVYAVTGVSLSLAAGTWLLAAQAMVHNTSGGAAGIDVILGPNSASATGGYVAGSAMLPTTASWVTVPLVAVVVLASPTTVYMNAESTVGSSGTVINSAGSYFNDVTGITATRIA